jgi:hypothetical protein
MLGGFALYIFGRIRADVRLPVNFDVCENCDTRVATVTDEPNFGASMNNPEKK